MNVTAAETPPLNAPGPVVLISCYELGHQPMGVAMPAAFLRRAGVTPVVKDVAVERFDPEWVRDTWFVGIAVPMHTALRLGVHIAAQVRAANPDAVICFYGLYAALNAEYLLAEHADYCIGGEYEGPLTELVAALAAGTPVSVPGVAQVNAPAQPALARLTFPVPDRRGLPEPAEYAKLLVDGEERQAGYVEATRGCKHRCLHCPITPVYDGRFFVVPVDTVLEDARQQVAAGARHLTFGDPDFLNGPRHAMAVARGLHAEWPDVTFDITAKVEHLLKHRDLLPELAALGCVFIVSAVESFSDTVLEHLHKGHTRADAVEAIALCQAAGTPMRPSFVAFTPWGTLEDYLDTLRLVAALDVVDAVDPVQYSVRLLVPPGSALLDSAAMQPFLGPLDAAAFAYPWTHPDPRMDALHREVGAAVEAAACAGDDPRDTFATVWQLAHEAAGSAERIESSPAVYLNRARVPRLTESWFC